MFLKVSISFEICKRYDRDRSGQLDKKEFKKALKSLGHNKHSKQVCQLSPSLSSPHFHFIFLSFSFLQLYFVIYIVVFCLLLMIFQDGGKYIFMTIDKDRSGHVSSPSSSPPLPLLLPLLLSLLCLFVISFLLIMKKISEREFCEWWANRGMYSSGGGMQQLSFPSLPSCLIFISFPIFIFLFFYSYFDCKVDTLVEVEGTCMEKRRANTSTRVQLVCKYFVIFT